MPNQNLLENNLFLSLLSGGGQALSEGNSLASGLNPIVQQTIGAKSKENLQNKYIDKLTKAGLGFTSGPKGEVTIKAENMKQFVDILEGGEGGSEGVGTQDLSIKPESGLGGLGGMDAGGLELSKLLNPSSSSPGSSFADLAGLTPKDVSEAFSGAVDLKYKEGLIDYYKRQGDAKSTNRTYPIKVPGVGNVTLNEWKALPLNDRSYAAYVHQSKLHKPGEPVMEQGEWNRTVDKDTKTAYIRGLLDNTDLKDLAMEMAQAGAIKIGDIGPRAEAGAIGRQRAAIQAPDFPQAVQEDLMEDAAAWHDPEGVDAVAKAYNITPEEAIAAIQKSMIVEEMDSRIHQIYKNVDKRSDGWYVDGVLKVRNPYAK